MPTPSSEKWYDSKTDLPPLKAAVRVNWSGHVFIAMRVVHPKRARVEWATVVDGELVYLPRKKDRRKWDAQPGAWQPKDAAQWPYDLPEPIYRPDRPPAPEAPSQPEIDRLEARDPKSAFWWRDAAQVTYSPAGLITAREAEARVKRAILTDGLRKEKFARMTQHAWPAELLEVAEAIDNPDRPLPARFEPTPADIDDSLVAMAWFAALDPPEMRHMPIRPNFVILQSVLILRAVEPPYTWEQTGREIGRSHTRAQQLHAEAVERITKAANGGFAYDHIRTDHIAELRKRNREAART